MIETDVLIIGSGLAGCATALELAKRGVQVTLLSTRQEVRESASFLAGGGVAYRGENDSPELFKEDILRQGAGLALPKAAEQLAEMGPQCVEETLLNELQVNFEHAPEGNLKLAGREGHSTERTIWFSDHTGKAVIDAILRRLAEFSNVTILAGHTAVDLITLSHHSTRSADLYKHPTCTGAYVLNHESGEVETFFAKETVLATGGMGEIFLHTTNPSASRGDGIAMAHRAGVRVMNLEYMQFHPIALCLPNQRRLLLPDRLRQSGAQLLTQTGETLQLAPTANGEEVARAIYVEMLRSGADHLWLDMSTADRTVVEEQFPNLHEYCLTKGFDLTKGPLPVVPAAHYACGGVAVDRAGRTTMQRLRAVGEVACTGVHGAGRLLGTAMLENLVWGKTTATDIAEQIDRFSYYFPTVEEWQMCDDEVDPSLIRQDWTSIKQTMWNYVGLVRDDRRLRRAQKMLRELRWEVETFYESARLTPELIGLRNGVLTSLLVARAATLNKRSVGCHYRQPNVTEVTIQERELALT